MRYYLNVQMEKSWILIEKIWRQRNMRSFFISLILRTNESLWDFGHFGRSHTSGGLWRWTWRCAESWRVPSGSVMVHFDATSASKGPARRCQTREESCNKYHWDLRATAGPGVFVGIQIGKSYGKTNVNAQCSTQPSRFLSLTTARIDHGYSPIPPWKSLLPCQTSPCSHLPSSGLSKFPLRIFILVKFFWLFN